MGSCKGLHCEGCGHGGGPAGAVIALVVIIALAARAAMPAIVSAVEIAAWTVAGVTGVAVVVTGGVLTAKAVRRRRAREALTYRPAQPYIVVEAQNIRLPRRPAPGEIEPPDTPRWPVTGWQPSGWEPRPPIGGDGDERRRR